MITHEYTSILTCSDGIKIYSDGDDLQNQIINMLNILEVETKGACGSIIHNPTQKSVFSCRKEMV